MSRSASSSASTRPSSSRGASARASRSQTVHAVDHGRSACARARWWGSWANRAAASRTLGRARSAVLTRRARARCVIAGTPRRLPRQIAPPAARGADDLPGPVRVAQPAHARRATSSARRRWCTASWRGDASTYVAQTLKRVGLDPSYARRYPAPVLRRTARAHRHRPGAGGEAELPGLRRSGGRARRLDPGAGAQPVHAPARGARPHLPVHQPRPRRRAPRRRPRGRHVPRARRRDRTDAGTVRRARTTRTRRRCWPRCRASTRAKRTLRADQGRDPLAAGAALRLPLPSALSACDAALRAARRRRCARSRRAGSRPAI